MSTFIDQEEFKLLANGDKLYGHGRMFEIETANCGEPGKHPTHRVSTEVNGAKEYDYIFHDGQDIKYSSTEDKDLDGALVSELIDDGNCRVIKRAESIRNTTRMRNLSLIGTGKYCSLCGGLCGNSNHHEKRC